MTNNNPNNNPLHKNGYQPLPSRGWTLDATTGLPPVLVPGPYPYLKLPSDEERGILAKVGKLLYESGLEELNNKALDACLGEASNKNVHYDT
ncbi:MAG: hypothetical protein JSS96_13980 [Bacteroidetes bacterium]|nr:hypothetical protein [Bacteroidota bacterium]